MPMSAVTNSTATCSDCCRPDRSGPVLPWSRLNGGGAPPDRSDMANVETAPPQPGMEMAERVRTEAERLGALAAYRALIAENDAWIQRPTLDDGRALVAARSVIHTEMVRRWAVQEHHRFGYDKPFAVVSLGGTGRGEVTPASDLDFAFLVDDSLEGNAFLLHLQRQLINSREFEEANGFGFEPLPFNLDDAPTLSDKQLNAFVDLRPVYDPTSLAERFRERIRATYDAFEHFLHVRGFWQGQWEKAATEIERLDKVDIKNDALRVFLAGIWTLAGKHFEHSHDIYARLEDPRDLEAYGFLLRIRCFLHSRHPPGIGRSGGDRHFQDQIRFEDLTAFGEMLGADADELARFTFANDVRARLLGARRRVARFTRGVIDRELKAGRPAGPASHVIYGIGGLHHKPATPPTTAEEKSRAALSLLLASQRYGVPIDPAELQRTFQNIGDWLVPVPELATLFYEQRGSLADSFSFLAQFESAEDRLFPGYSRFETSLDARVMTERRMMRGALERRKMRTLEEFVREGRRKLAEAVSPEKLTDVTRRVDVTVEAALLDAHHLAAVKLALKVKRLPVTADDRRLRADETLPLHQRFSSGLSDIPLESYFLPIQTSGGFPEETLRIARALVAGRRAFKNRADTPNDAGQVQEFVQECGDEQFLRALFVFTCADRAEWESVQDDPARWFNSRELYFKALMAFRPSTDSGASIRMLGYPEEEARILKDFGEDFWAGEYRQHASTFASVLRRLAEDPETGGSKAVLLPDAGAPILGVAARDYRGLAACITGELWRHKIGLRQAHLFSAMNFGLALDFFHIQAPGRPVGREILLSIEDAVRGHLHIAEADESSLPRLLGQTTLRPWHSGLWWLRHETREDTGGLVYALAYKVFRHLRGNIFGLVAHAARGTAYISVYHSIASEIASHEAHALVAQHFHSVGGHSG